ncbi:MAG: DUF3943 domain-containing protein [bacterium]
MANKIKCISSLFFTFILLISNALQAAPPAPRSVFQTFTMGKVVPGESQKFGFLYTSISAYAFQWVFVNTINRNLGRDIRKSSFQHWLKNMTTLPEIPDGDSWVTNYIGHPLLGATVFVFYKNRGFSDKQSLAGTFLQSTLFEYTVEGWKKPPSGVDLVVTPLVGSLIGSQIGLNSVILSSSYALTKYIFGLF